MLQAVPIPGFFITGTDTDVGKTVIAAAIANWFHRRSNSVSVCKIAATGCELREGKLFSADAEALATAIDHRFASQVICPLRYLEPLAPAVAADRVNNPVDWLRLQASLSTMARESKMMIVEGVGGIMVPMDHRYTVLDVARWLRLPVIVVARAGLGTINHTVLTVNALRSANVPVAGVIVNRFIAASDDIAMQTNPTAIARWTNVPVLCVVEEANLSAIDTVDWASVSRLSSQASSTA